MAENCQAVWNELMRMFGGNGIGLLFLSALAYLFLSGKNRRRQAAWPALILCALILEPHMYQFLQKYMLGNTYWRLLWLIPVMPVIACAAADIVGRIRRKTVAALALGGILLLIAGCGSYVYGHSLTSFSKAANPYKIPQKAVEVCDFLLEQDAHPRIVAQQTLNYYIRQYSADIQLMYGRDADGYIQKIDEERKQVDEELNCDDPDLAYVYEIMEKLNYSYLVKNDYDETLDAVYLDAGFERIGLVGGFGIFRRI